MDFAKALDNSKQSIQQQLAHRDALIVQAKRRADDVVDTFSKVLAANTGAAVFRQAMDIAAKAVTDPVLPPAYSDVFSTSETTRVSETAVPSAASQGGAAGNATNALPSAASKMLGPVLAALGIASGGALGVAAGSYLFAPKPETQAPAIAAPANGSLKEALRKEGLNLPPLETKK